MFSIIYLSLRACQCRGTHGHWAEWSLSNTFPSLWFQSRSQVPDWVFQGLITVDIFLQNWLCLLLNGMRNVQKWLIQVIYKNIDQKEQPHFLQKKTTSGLLQSQLWTTRGTTSFGLAWSTLLRVLTIDSVCVPIWRPSVLLTRCWKASEDKTEPARTASRSLVQRSRANSTSSSGTSRSGASQP